MIKTIQNNCDTALFYNIINKSYAFFYPVFFLDKIFFTLYFLLPDTGFSFNKMSILVRPITL